MTVQFRVWIFCLSGTILSLSLSLSPFQPLSLSLCPSLISLSFWMDLSPPLPHTLSLSLSLSLTLDYLSLSLSLSVSLSLSLSLPTSLSQPLYNFSLFVDLCPKLSISLSIYIYICMYFFNTTLDSSLCIALSLSHPLFQTNRCLSSTAQAMQRCSVKITESSTVTAAKPPADMHGA